VKSFQPSQVPEYEDLESKITSLGLNRENFRVLMLLPSIYVAWSDGEITEEESRNTMEIATQCGLVREEEASLLRQWLSQRPSATFFEEGLHLLSLILAAIPEGVEGTAEDAVALAETVARASGGVFGLLFTVSSQEKAALRKIEGILHATQGPSWQKLLDRLGEDWRITDWKTLEEPTDISAHDAGDPFLFTSAKAIEDYKAGQFTKADGSPCTLDDLERDLKTESMRLQDWSEIDLQFRTVLNQLLEQGLIEDTGLYWNNSPHGVVYEIKDNIKIHLLGQEFRLREGRQIVFQCQMSRDMNNLDGPFITGTFVPTAESMLCGEMANAMMGMKEIEKMDMGEMGGMSGDEMMEMADIPPVELAKVQVNDSVRVVYFLVDTSGSMCGRPIEQAKAALLSFLQNIPPSPNIRVGLRNFESTPGRLMGSLKKPYSSMMKSFLITSVSQLEAGGSTSLYQCVDKALDDIQRNIQNNQAPKTFLIVLSDGEDNQGIRENRYEGKSGESAFFQRMQEFRNAGLVEYLPLAYGGAVEGLDQIGGPGFQAEVTSPSAIIQKFAQIRKQVMVGMPMGMGMAKGGM
jgi:Mg-chelatase subunit ChlD/tellurite resistance protein